MINLNFFEKLTIRIMKNGQIPKHVAFIMDGNRRFGKQESKAALTGHQEGAKTLKKCLLYCLELGIKRASFYAFSLENFNRKKQEVEFLMNLANKQFQDLDQIDNQDNLADIVMKHNVKIVIVGDLQGRLKEEYSYVKEGLQKIQEKTKNHTAMTVYICFAYDSLFQIKESSEKTIKKGFVKQEYEEQVQRNLQIPHPVDLMIRTSNEHRLSNFLLMQSKNAIIEIDKNFWPSFNLYTFAKILLKYNYYSSDLKKQPKYSNQ